MNRLLAMLLIVVLTLANSCGGGSSSDTTTTTATVPSIIGVSKDAGSFGAFVANNQGESLMPMVSRDSSGKITGITGALWSNASGASATVYLGSDGLPTRAVMGDFIILFENWNTTADTVDVAVSYSDFVQAFKGVSINPKDLVANIASPAKLLATEKATCFPACDTDAENLGALIKLAGLSISVGVCAVGIATTWGAMAIPCTGVLVTTATLVVGNESWLNNLETASTYFTASSLYHCVEGPAECVAAVLEVGGTMVAGSDTTLTDNASHVTTADVFLKDPARADRDTTGTVPTTSCVLSSAYECTSASFLPCFTGGTKTCGSDCKWGSCPASSTTTVATFDGTYTGGYSGSCTSSEGTASVSGSATLVVSNGSIAVSSDGGNGSGTVNSQGGSSFGAGGGGGISYSFSGTFSVSGSSGSWTASNGSDTSCSGSWSVAR